MTKVQRAAKRLIEEYGSVRKAAEASGIDHAYLHRLKTGKKAHPTESILKKLGLRKNITYQEVPRETSL